jgi:hypothetical protein
MFDRVNLMWVGGASVFGFCIALALSVGGYLISGGWVDSVAKQKSIDALNITLLEMNRKQNLINDKIGSMDAKLQGMAGAVDLITNQVSNISIALMSRPVTNNIALPARSPNGH